MFTHLNVLEATSFTTGEILSGSSSGVSGVVQSISAQKISSYNKCFSCKTQEL